MENRTRKIEFKAKLDQPASDQPRLPIGPSQHFGRHIPIPEGMKAELKADARPLKAVVGPEQS